ncbi:MAG TPA: hypothetical protein VJZ06_02875 [Mobilitalea sp.]|nr:hypothetical protein [Mobilitalea sp.]
MKTWNTPEISELNIKETANGIFDACFESYILYKDSKATTDPVDDPVNNLS